MHEDADHLAALLSRGGTRTTPGYASLTGFFAFYPSRMDRCTVDGQEVTAQERDFYGGWITAEVRGPFEGAPGTRLW
ncbi:hypothetical protein [Streptomyces flaveolus]|uniref:hypothetical protein n=1 Tax=Streptomyces flaveolus TaxID=67297 RepID=UPI003401C2F5